MRAISCFLFLASVAVLTSCGSTPLQPETGVGSSFAEEFPPSSTYLRLKSKLRDLGYESVGMQYESDATLEFLYQVFDNSKAAKRRIKLVYTGLALSYDVGHQSLTIGGTLDPQVVLAFIDRQVPLLADKPKAPPPAPKKK